MGVSANAGVLCIEGKPDEDDRDAMAADVNRNKMMRLSYITRCRTKTA